MSNAMRQDDAVAGSASADVLPDAIEAQLERVLTSDDFVNGPKLGQFLDYVVRQTLVGQSTRIKQYTIAVQGMGYGANFDPKTSPTVRMLARRLRRALDQYYANRGASDPIRISIPKGSYVPVFLLNADETKNGQAVREPSVSSPVSDEPHGTRLNYPSVAVMPLEFLGNAPEFDYVATGLTEEIIIALNRFPDIAVVGPLSKDIIREENLDPFGIRQKYGVRFLLDGSVRFRREKSLRISAKLTDTSDGRHAWGRTFEHDVEATSIDELEHELVGLLVAEVADNFGVIPRTLTRELSPDHNKQRSGYEAILRFHHHNRTLTEETYAQAATAMETALRNEPDNDQIMGLLADLIATPHFMGYVDDLSSLERSETLARKALALNPNSQEARFALAQVYYLNSDKARCSAEVERTLAVNPNNSNFLAISALFLTGLGQQEEGAALIKRAMRLNPHHPGWYHFIPFTYHYYRGEFKVALVDAEGFNTPDFYIDPLIRAAALGQLGHHADAKKARSQLLALVPDFETRGRDLIKRMVFKDEHVYMLEEGLRKAGLLMNS